jgi:hypothetical protein
VLTSAERTSATAPRPPRRAARARGPAAVLLGVLVLGEHVASTPLDLVGEIPAAAVVVAGTVLITRHSAAVLRDDRAGVPTPVRG